MTVGPVRRDGATEAFFDGTARGELLIRRCPDGHASEPTAAQCTTCGRLDLGWEPASGRAWVVSWIVVPAEPSEGAASPPTVEVIAELAEGPWWWAQLVGADPDVIAVGTHLEIGFDGHDDYERVPIFHLAG